MVKIKFKAENTVAFVSTIPSKARIIVLLTTQNIIKLSKSLLVTNQTMYF